MNLDPAHVEAVISPSAQIAETVLVRGRGVLKIADFVVIEDHVLIDLGQSGGQVELGPRCKLKYGVVLRCYNGKISIDARTSVGEYTVIAAHGGVTIGRDVGIAGHCTLAASNHIIASSSVPIRYRGETAVGITISDGVWIAAGVRVLDGVTVGEGSAIGAGAVITHSIPEYQLALGVPCRVVRPIDVPSDVEDRQ